jgi:toxin secretion/phage lysis holin
MVGSDSVQSDQLMNQSKYSLAAGAKWIAAFGVAIHVKTPAPLEILALLLAVDWITGLAAAYVNGCVSSDVGRKGLVVKLLTMLALWLLYLAEAYARKITAGSQLPPWMVVPAAGTVAFGYIVNEAVSIVENFGHAGVPLPSWAVSALVSVKRWRFQPATPEQLRELERDRKEGLDR